MKRHRSLKKYGIMVLALALAAILAMPGTLLSQETEDVQTTISEMQAAFNAGDVDTALGYFAEDAIVEILPREAALPGAPFEGHEEIRGWLESETAANAQMEMTVQEADNGSVMAAHTLTSDALAQMGIESLQATDEFVFEDGLIARQTINLSEASVAAIREAYAQQQAAPASEAGFTNASAEGHYAVEVTAGPLVAAGVGTCDLDGMGNYTCTITQNMPTEAGERMQAVSAEEGTYAVNADGTSVASGTRILPDGTEMEINYDCVTTEAEQSDAGRLITDLRCLQREAISPAGALSVASMSRLPAMQAEESTARTPEETFHAHLQAFGSGDVDTILADFAEDATVITVDGALHGHEEIRGLVEQLVSAFPPGSTFEVQEQVIDGNVVYFQWMAESDQFVVPSGTDTLIIRDGLIQTQTVTAPMEAKN